MYHPQPAARCDVRGKTSAQSLSARNKVIVCTGALHDGRHSVGEDAPLHLIAPYVIRCRAFQYGFKQIRPFALQSTSHFVEIIPFNYAPREV